MKFIVSCVIVWMFPFITKPVRGEIYANIELSTVELIRKDGYPLEIFANIPTEDKYLLDVYRIPHGKLKNGKHLRPAVILMNGLLCTSRDFVILGPERSLAYFLADRGYDVWLANARGTVYSRKHLVFNPDVDAKYWDFSFHEIGIYDLPAIFALVRTVTRREQISYIGFSQGTTAFYVLTSLRPEYNKNITIMVSLAPVTYMQHFFSPVLKFLALLEPILTPFAKIFGVNEFPPQIISRVLSVANRVFCPMQGVYQDVCASILFVLGGYDIPQLNKTTLPAIFSESRIASTRQLLHYAQNVNTGEFSQYSYGLEGNLRRYGSVQPSPYNVSKTFAPVAVFYGEGDWLSHFKDAERLVQVLPNCVYKYRVPYKDFNHFDFLVANDVIKLVYENVFYILDKSNQNIK